MTLDENIKRLFAEYGLVDFVNETIENNPNWMNDPNVINYAENRFGTDICTKVNNAGFIKTITDHAPKDLKAQKGRLDKLDKKDTYRQILEEINPNYEKREGLDYWLRIGTIIGADFSKEESLKELITNHTINSKLKTGLISLKQNGSLDGLLKALKDEKNLDEAETSILKLSEKYGVGSGIQQLTFALLDKTEKELERLYEKEVTDKEGKKSKVEDEDKYRKDISTIKDIIERYIVEHKEGDILAKTYNAMTAMKEALAKRS